MNFCNFQGGPPSLSYCFIIQRALLLTALCVIASACVLPPPEVDSRVLPPEEVSVVTLLKRGEHYSRSGRTDLAEIEFRKAMALQPDLPNLRNNLGYALLEQNRLKEALGYFESALEADPKDKSAFDNLIRTYYRLGEYHKVIDGYRAMLRIIPPQEVIDTAADDVVPALSVFDVVRLYRDLATVYYAIGKTDEAVCYSVRAVQVLGTPTQLLLHARMMLSLNKPGAAVPVLRQLVGGVGDSLGAALIDYGVALYLTNDWPLAEQAVDRVIARSGLSPSNFMAASVVKLLLTRSEKSADSEDGEIAEGDSARKELVQDSVLENMPEFCSELYSKLPDYWPELILIEVDQLYEQVCNGREQYSS